MNARDIDIMRQVRKGTARHQRRRLRHDSARQIGDAIGFVPSAARPLRVPVSG